MLFVRNTILALLIGALSLSCTAKTNFDNVCREMVIILQNGHYAKLSFDDTMSERILTDYINLLDPQHVYFTQEQIKGIRSKYATELDNIIFKTGAMSPAQEIFDLFLSRVKMRVSYSNTLLDAKDFNFDSDETILIDREDTPWPISEDDAKLLWKKQLKDAVLSELLRRESIASRANDLEKEATNYLKDELDPYEKVKKRFERILITFTEFDEEDIANYFLSTVAAAYDPHSDYYSQRETEEFRSSISNSLVGIGALLSSEDDGATQIKGIVINGPADRQGELQLDDRIIGVDPVSEGDMIDILYMPLNKVVGNIRGKENSKVTLKVEPANGAPGETKLITIERETIEMRNQMVSGEIYQLKPQANSLEAPLKLGWMKIPSFYKDFQENTTSVARDVESILKRMNEENVDGLIVDLKGNGGGSLDEVQRITGYFTGQGPVVQVKDSLGKEKIKNSYSKKPIFTKPVIVHVDKTSASASEILAAALQDYNRAVIVGDQSTFGKGTVQTPMEIAKFLKWYQDTSRAGTVKATIQKFYRISGGSTQLKGVESDIIIPSIAHALEIGEEYAKHALTWDNIDKCSYKTGDRETLNLSNLRKNSEQRVKEDLDFSYIDEDVSRTKERLKGNTISLNIEKRRQEIKESEERRKVRVKERRARYKEIEQKDFEAFDVYRMRIDDIETYPLPKVMKDDQSYMKTSKEELEELDDSPDLPSNLDASKREALSILKDLILSKIPEETVKVED